MKYVEANSVSTNPGNQTEAAVDENGYLRPISNPENSAFVEEVKYSKIIAENET